MVDLESPPPVAWFEGVPAVLEARFGAPVERADDPSGRCFHALTFPCGLAVVLARDRLAREHATYEVCTGEADLDHVAVHLEVALRPARPAPAVPRPFVVMRTDDNGNDVEVARASTRCEAVAIARRYEERAHKQMYWVAG